jgi:uncharacterized membrane protein
MPSMMRDGGGDGPDSVCAVADLMFRRAHGVVVSHLLSMREALGSIPSVSIFVGVISSWLIAIAAYDASYTWTLGR